MFFFRVLSAPQAELYFAEDFSPPAPILAETHILHPISDSPPLFQPQTRHLHRWGECELMKV